MLSWLLQASAADVDWIFSKVLGKHGQLFELLLYDHKAAWDPKGSRSIDAATLRAAKPQISQLKKLNSTIGFDELARFESAANKRWHPDRTSEEGKLASVLAREAIDYHHSMHAPPIVQFSTHLYFCTLDTDEKGDLKEPFITLDVMRIGNLSSKSEIKYTTRDESARAGEKFVETSGWLRFAEESNAEQIRIDLLKNDVFDTTTEFKVELLNDPDRVNCQTGRYLFHTRVKVIDGNAFPSNRFSVQLRLGDSDKIPFWSLAWEYVKFNIQHPVTKKGTIKWILVDLASSLHLLLQWLCDLYLVDHIMVKQPDDAWIDLTFIAIIFIIPLMLLHYLEYRRTTWKVGGSSRQKLQTFLLRKFLNYDNSVRKQLSSADLVMAMTRDASDIVHEGYLQFLDLLSSLMDLVAVLIFQVIVPYVPVFDAAVPNMSGFVFLLAVPTVLMVFLRLRYGITSRHISRQNFCEEEIALQAERTVVNYRLIADFHQRPFFEEKFDKVVKLYNAARVEANQVKLNNSYFASWLTMICVTVYTIHGGLQVIHEPDTLSLGLFLANLRILKSIGQSSGVIYKILMNIEATSPALYKMVKLVNLPTDMHKRKAVNREQRAKTAALREEARQTTLPGWPVDKLPIEMNNLKFEYDSTKGPVISIPGRMRFWQGELTALVGPAGEGKSTLLYMLGGVVMPEPGQLFMPSHLRVIHVPMEIFFFKATLFENLTFACCGTHDDVNIVDASDGRMDRVLTICKRLGFPEDILQLIETGRDGPVMQWSEMLAHSHKALLQFARAVITNPEFMCVHKPIMTYTEGIAGAVLAMLREFCEHKGVEQDEASRHTRRPRTCVITASKVRAVDSADHIWLVSRSKGIRHVPRNYLNVLTDQAAEGLTAEHTAEPRLMSL